jgi:hypothetical protein
VRERERERKREREKCLESGVHAHILGRQKNRECREGREEKERETEQSQGAVVGTQIH